MDDRARFELLYQEHAGAVLTFVRRRWRLADADDIVAEVFLAAWRRLDEAPADPLPWLLGIGRGVLSNRRRGAARATALHERLRSEPPPAVEAAVTDGSTAIMRALSQLGEADRELLLLVAWERLTQQQIATMLGVSRGAVAVRLHRARSRLTRTLERDQSAVDVGRLHTEEMAP